MPWSALLSGCRNFFLSCSDVLPVFGRVIVESQHGIFIFSQAFHGFWIFRIETRRTVIKCFISFFKCFCLPDIVQCFLDLGLHGIGKFFQYIGGFMYPAALLIGLRPTFGNSFPQSQRAVTDRQFRRTPEAALFQVH